jgi:hypothetical protein
MIWSLLYAIRFLVFPLLFDSKNWAYSPADYRF